MVANAADTGSLSPLAAWACLISSIAMTVAGLLVVERLQYLRLVPLAKTPEALADRARDTIERLGYKPLPYETHGFIQDNAYLDHIEKTDPSPGRWEALRIGQPAVLRFWLRQSPVEITPGHPANTLTEYADPPFTVPGTVGIWLDTKGRLVHLDAVPPQHATATPSATATNWTGLFEAAGMTIGEFRPVPSEWSPAAFADERQAWEGVYPDAKEIPVRIEAAAFAGKPVSFRIIEPWSASADAPAIAPGLGASVTSIIEVALPIVILIAGTILAVRNIRLGRSDRRGAFRIGLYLFVVRMLVWILAHNNLTGASSGEVFRGNFSYSLFRFVVVWISYVAIEPYLRRLWPRTLISWTRALEGRWRDPLVGRDCLLAATAASAIWLGLSGWPLFEQWRGTPVTARDIGLDVQILKSLNGLLPAASAMLFQHAQFLLVFGFTMVVLLVLLRLLTRRTWIALTIWIPLSVIVIDASTPQLVLFILLSAATLTVFFRLGVLGLMVFLGLTGLQIPAPVALSTTAWYAGPMWLFLAIFVAVAVYGFLVSLGGRRAFGGILAEE
jgi:serine/threonine-protein kinase